MKLLLISPQNVYATQRLVQESSKLGIKIMVIDAQEVAARNYDINPVDFDALYIRQAYIDFEHKASDAHLQGVINLARRFDSAGKVVVDQSIAESNLGHGKYDALTQLQKQGTVLPRTRLLSADYQNIAVAAIFSEPGSRYPTRHGLKVNINGLAFPYIAKWNYGFGAQHTYLIKTIDDLVKIEQKYPGNEIMIQEFVPADFEYKIITVGYKALPVVIKLKTNHNKFLPDLNQHQVLKISDAPLAVELAEKASRLLRRELAKVDILQAGDKFYVLEVNRWPGLQYFEKITKFNAVKAFLQYIQSCL